MIYLSKGGGAVPIPTIRGSAPAVKLAQSIGRSFWVREVVRSSPVSTNALVKTECALNSLGQGTHC